MVVKQMTNRQFLNILEHINWQLAPMTRIRFSLQAWRTLCNEPCTPSLRSHWNFCRRQMAKRDVDEALFDTYQYSILKTHQYVALCHEYRRPLQLLRFRVDMLVFLNTLVHPRALRKKQKRETKSWA